jgi:small subunit ribosomal protein S20
MPNIKSAQKRMELSRAARSKNRAERSKIRTAIKRVRAASPEEAQARLVEAQAVLDRAATRRLVHPNAVARLKGQLMKHVNSVTAA